MYLDLVIIRPDYYIWQIGHEEEEEDTSAAVDDSDDDI